MTRYAVQCANGYPSDDTWDTKTEARAWANTFDTWHPECGPHTVVELPEPCPCGKKPNGCDCPTYEQFINGPGAQR